MKRNIFARFLRGSAMRFKGEGGYSLIGLALFTVGFGIVMTSGVMVYNQWRARETIEITNTRIAKLQETMRAYLALNGRYPCPASLTAPLTSPQYGVEMKTTPTATACTGQYTGTGTDGRRVWTGAVPVRTLNLPDEMAMDGWDHRIAYTITEAYTDSDNAPLNQNLSAITIVDGSNNNASASAGSITYAFLTMGDDTRGAYSANGVLLSPCAPATPAGQNCRYQDNVSGGKLINNTKQAHTRNANQFTHRVDYRTAPVAMCPENPSTDASKNIAYLVDTSGSMTEDGGCPLSLGTKCSRIDVARWAMRRVVPIRLEQNAQNAKNDDPNNPPVTLMTGFVDDNKNTTSTKIYNKLGDISVKDESAAIDDIENLCPSGSTPLGVHIEALARKLLGATVPTTKKGKILVISDGLSNIGEDPVSVVTRLHGAGYYPNLQVDIIDVTGNPELRKVAEITGGTYSLSTDGDKMLSSILSLSGVCTNGPMTPKNPPVDKHGCGSSGNW